MKTAFRVLTVLLLISGGPAKSQINTLPINWSNFKGAKTIQLSFTKHPDSTRTNIILNEKGKVRREETFYRGQLSSQTIYIYDREGRVKERNRSDMMDTKTPASSQHVFVYVGDKCEESHISNDGSTSEKILSNFNAAGQKISETHFREGGFKSGIKGDSYQFTYDDSGNQTGIFLSRAKDAHLQPTWPDSVLSSKNIIEYDKYNNPVAFKIYNVSGNITGTQRFSYVYDEHHNWTKRIATARDASGKITGKSSTELAITYY